MKAIELRVGNWVMGDAGIPYQFGLVDFANWYNDYNSHEYGDHIHPIHITKRLYDSIFVTSNCINLVHLEDEYWVTLEYHYLCEQDTNGEEVIWVYVNNVMVTEIKYLHELQNFHYGFFRSELVMML